MRDNCGFSRLELLRFLDEKRIGTRLIFAGNLTKQPYMSGRKFRVVGELTNTDRVMNNCFWLGVYPGLHREQLEYVVEQIEEFCGIGF